MNILLVYGLKLAYMHKTVMFFHCYSISPSIEIDRYFNNSVIALHCFPCKCTGPYFLYFEILLFHFRYCCPFTPPLSRVSVTVFFNMAITASKQHNNTILFLYLLIYFLVDAMLSALTVLNYEGWNCCSKKMVLCYQTSGLVMECHNTMYERKASVLYFV